MSDDDLIRRGDALHAVDALCLRKPVAAVVEDAIAALPAVTTATSPGVTAGAGGELLPCPFCGASATLIGQLRSCAYVACGECGVVVHGAYFKGGDDAITAWNRRAPVDVNETALCEHQTGLMLTDAPQAPVEAMARALDAVAQHDRSGFYGPDAEKNRNQSWRGVRRKAKAALAEYKAWKGAK